LTFLDPPPPSLGGGRAVEPVLTLPLTDLFKLPELLFIVLPPPPPSLGGGRAVEPALTLPLTDLFKFPGLLFMIFPPGPPQAGLGRAVVPALATVEKVTRKKTAVKMEKIVFKIHLQQLN
jgi:hypothetical protein